MDIIIKVPTAEPVSPYNFSGTGFGVAKVLSLTKALNTILELAIATYEMFSEVSTTLLEWDKNKTSSVE